MKSISRRNLLGTLLAAPLSGCAAAGQGGGLLRDRFGHCHNRTLRLNTPVIVHIVPDVVAIDPQHRTGIVAFTLPTTIPQIFINEGERDIGVLLHELEHAAGKSHADMSCHQPQLPEWPATTNPKAVHHDQN